MGGDYLKVGAAVDVLASVDYGLPANESRGDSSNLPNQVTATTEKERVISVERLLSGSVCAGYWRERMRLGRLVDGTG